MDAAVQHHVLGRGSESAEVSGGVAAGDYNGDGWVDLFVAAGHFQDALLKNLGNGRFENVSQEAGVALDDGLTSGPSFFDFDGDGLLDLLVGGVEETPLRLFRNLDGEVFEEVTESSGLYGPFNSLGHAAGDYDNDGDLDIFVARWGTLQPGAPGDGHLWRNEGDGTFSQVPDAESGLDLSEDYDELFLSFAPNFADANNDGWMDLLVVSDFGTSKVFLNQGDGTFLDVTDDVISDENGMGSAIADYDRDGDLDWFVTSIWDPDGEVEGAWGITGNRLYRNRGDGTFEDVTTEAGVRRGYWGWGACFADFNNDGYPDIFHVNGFSATDEFDADPSRLFLARGDGTFVEQSMESGIVDTGQGRGIVCCDYDRDGDVDIYIANNTGLTKLYRNDTEAKRHFLNVTLSGQAPNTQGVGAKVTVTAGGFTQREEMRLHNNYVSNQPAELHFGLGTADRVDELTIEWPDGRFDLFQDVDADEFVIAGRGELSTSTVKACTDGPTAMCLHNGRFEVTATFETLAKGSIVGHAVPMADGEKAGYLWFSEPDYPEIVVKIIDACTFSDRYWVYVSGLTNVGVDLRIRDSQTGQTLDLRSPLGSPFLPIRDASTFATCP